MFFYPKEDILRVFVDIFIGSVSGMGVQKGVLGGCSGFLTGDMDDRVIPDVISDVLLPQGRHSENFVLISHFEVCQEGGGQEGGYLADIEGS